MILSATVRALLLEVLATLLDNEADEATPNGQAHAPFADRAYDLIAATADGAPVHFTPAEVVACRFAVTAYGEDHPAEGEAMAALA